MIPGFGASIRSYDAIFEARGEQRLIAVDLPRTGESKHWAPSTPEGIAEELARWLKRHGVREYTVFGHSFGGLAALELARREPKHVEALVVASAPALGLPPDAKMFLANPAVDQVVTSMWQLATFRPVMRAYLQWLWGRSKLPPEVVDAYLQSVRAEGFAGGIVEAMRAVAAYRLPHEGLKQAAVPTTVLWGEKDPLVTVVYGEHLATSLGAPYRVLPDTGHCVPEEQPAAVIAAITAR